MALAAAVCLQFVWVSVLACAVQCARGQCPAAGDHLPGNPASHHCGESNAPSDHGGNPPHGPHCPAALHYGLETGPVVHSARAGNALPPATAAETAPVRAAAAATTDTPVREIFSSLSPSPPLIPLRI